VTSPARSRFLRGGPVRTPPPADGPGRHLCTCSSSLSSFSIAGSHKCLSWYRMLQSVITWLHEVTILARSRLLDGLWHITDHDHAADVTSAVRPSIHKMHPPNTLRTFQWTFIHRCGARERPGCGRPSRPPGCSPVLEFISSRNCSASELRSARRRSISVRSLVTSPVRAWMFRDSSLTSGIQPCRMVNGDCFRCPPLQRREVGQGLVCE
jgi:hypothetical protein